MGIYRIINHIIIYLLYIKYKIHMYMKVPILIKNDLKLYKLEAFFILFERVFQK